MFPESLRWRLPLSYAAIALLATLVLGLVLLTILRSSYQQRELDYLSGNARAIGLELGDLFDQGLPASDVLAARLTSLSFLSQAQVRLLDLEGNVLADSGNPGSRQDLIDLSLDVTVETEISGQDLGNETERRITKSAIVLRKGEENLAGDDGHLTRAIVISTTGRSNIGLPGLPLENIIAEDEDILLFSVIGTPYGFGLSTEPVSAGRRSDQIVRYQITDPMGRPRGYVELSNGPAYGQAVLTSVALGWAIASAVAVLLAAVAGWFISRRLSSPLLTLTEATTHMAKGDLSVQATITRRDEVGQLAQAFNHMARQVEETVHTLRHFIADAAHELHTPLTALTTNLELAEGTTDPAMYIERARQQAARLETLANDLLALSRLESGAEESGPKPVNLMTLVRKAGEQYASQAEQAQLTFSLNTPHTAITVLGREAELQRALDNILNNALKFTPAGGEVILSLYQSGGMAIISVQDSGIGIPSADMPDLFSRFHRGRNTSSYPGSGLGLAIVKAVADRHGGQVAVSSDETGTRVLLKLNLMQSEAEE